VTLAETKRALRAQAKRARAAARADSPHAALQAAAHAIGTYRPERNVSVSAYWAVGDELDARPLLDALHARGCRVALPVVVEKGGVLAFRRWSPNAALARGVLDIPVPDWDAEPLLPTLLFVPVVAFDRSGARLGQGGGYYDRTLAALRANQKVTAVGYGYAAQELPEIPLGPHDQRLDGVVTEQGAFEARRTA
jgi:5-formyltetrahydrofolate cyclo-ligase